MKIRNCMWMDLSVYLHKQCRVSYNFHRRVRIFQASLALVRLAISSTGTPAATASRMLAATSLHTAAVCGAQKFPRVATSTTYTYGSSGRMMLLRRKASLNVQALRTIIPLSVKCFTVGVEAVTIRMPFAAMSVTVSRPGGADWSAARVSAVWISPWSVGIHRRCPGSVCHRLLLEVSAGADVSAAASKSS